MRVKRNYEAELLHELKYFSKCTKKIKDPNHYCISRELAKNLKITPRILGPTLRDMVKKGIVKKEEYILNHTRALRFIPIDLRLYEDESIIKMFEDKLETDLKTLKEIASKMRESPYVHRVKMIPLIPDLTGHNLAKHTNQFGFIMEKSIVKTRQYTSRRSPIGEKLLMGFCKISNELFEVINSLSLAISSGTLDQEKNQKVIDGLRKNTIDRIEDLIEYALRPCTARQHQAIYKKILSEIHTLFYYEQMKRVSKIKFTT